MSPLDYCSVHYTGARFIEMDITIEQFMSGYMLRVLKNYLFSNVLIARIHILGYGIFLVLAIYLLGILP